MEERIVKSVKNTPERTRNANFLIHLMPSSMTWSLPYWKAHGRSIGRQQLPQTIFESNLTSPYHCVNADLSFNFEKVNQHDC